MEAQGSANLMRRPMLMKRVLRSHFLVIPAKAATHAANIACFADSTKAALSVGVSCRGAMGPGFRRDDKSVNGGEALRLFRRARG
jgi:hypothetical protein